MERPEAFTGNAGDRANRQKVLASIQQSSPEAWSLFERISDPLTAKDDVPALINEFNGMGAGQIGAIDEGQPLSERETEEVTMDFPKGRRVKASVDKRGRVTLTHIS